MTPDKDLTANDIRNEMVAPGCTGIRKNELITLLVAAETANMEAATKPDPSVAPDHIAVIDPEVERAKTVKVIESFEDKGDLISLEIARNMRNAMMEVEVREHDISVAQDKVVADTATRVALAAEKAAEKKAADELEHKTQMEAQLAQAAG